MTNKKSILSFADLDSPKTDSDFDSINNTPDLSSSFSFAAPIKRQKVEETHRRQTWLIRSDLIDRLDRLAEGQGKGFKTQLVNQALEYAINELEKEQE